MTIKKKISKLVNIILISLKDKIVHIIISHPRLLTFRIVVAATFVIGGILCIINDPTYSASAISQSKNQNSQQDGP